jgi:hypothetical protein
MIEHIGLIMFFVGFSLGILVGVGLGAYFAFKESSK